MGCGGLHHRKVCLFLASELLARRRQNQAKLVRNKKNDALEKALAESIKVKKLHREASAQAENVASQIDSSPDWAWARTQESVGALRSLILELKEKKNSCESVHP